MPTCARGLISPPWTGTRSILFAVGSAISSGGVVFSFLSAILGASLSETFLYLALFLGSGIVLAALSTARVHVEDACMVVKRRILPPERYPLSSLVEFVDLASIEWFVALLRIPGLLLITASSLIATTTAFLWAYLRALSLPLAVIGAVLSGICFSSLEISTLISPGLGGSRPDNRLIVIASLALLAMGIPMLWDFPTASLSLERMAAAGSMMGMGLAGMINTLLGRSSIRGRVFRLRFLGGQLIYVSALTSEEATSFKRMVMEAIKNAETS